MLPEFELLMPHTLPEALDLLAQGGPDVVPLAGGTALLVDMRGGYLRHLPESAGEYTREPFGKVECLMDVSHLPASSEPFGKVECQQENGHVVVGGGVTIAGLLDDPLVARYGPVLGQAARRFANPLVRNRATLGGNLAYASPAADMAPPLLVLGAEVELASLAGTRRVALEDFLLGVHQTVRRPDELLTAVRWPLPAPQAVGAYRKLALRQATAVSVVSVAVMVEFDAEASPPRSGGFSDRSPRVTSARIALGAVAPRPVRAHAAEEVLRGQPLTPEAIAEAARLAVEATCCIDDLRGSATYRRRVTEVLVRRALTDVATFPPSHLPESFRAFGKVEKQEEG